MAVNIAACLLKAQVVDAVQQRSVVASGRLWAGAEVAEMLQAAARIANNFANKSAVPIAPCDL
jgi:hypothetical protein